MKQIFPKNVISQEIPIYSRQNSWLFTSLTKQLELGQRLPRSGTLSLASDKSEDFQLGR